MRQSFRLVDPQRVTCLQLLDSQDSPARCTSRRPGAWSVVARGLGAFAADQGVRSRPGRLPAEETWGRCEQHKDTLSPPQASASTITAALSLFSLCGTVLAVPRPLSACAVLVAIHNALKFTLLGPNHLPAAQPSPSPLLGSSNANTSRTVSSPITVQLRPSIHQLADIPPPRRQSLTSTTPRLLAALSLLPSLAGLHLSALATRALSRPERP
ncbi:hypothetical protein BU16DRAFT_597228 [Lophium mytilinum]|uniref:Uncharacterized protein n=1 Tax=Lophium mytilinum TaxID=390894 RepID=A0A6A6QCB8_9PEZI|nr:hypothetical protein BU16DRAFT_597228 [Lophium mytilinum]